MEVDVFDMLLGSKYQWYIAIKTSNDNLTYLGHENNNSICHTLLYSRPFLAYLRLYFLLRIIKSKNRFVISHFYMNIQIHRDTQNNTLKASDTVGFNIFNPLLLLISPVHYQIFYLAWHESDKESNWLLWKYVAFMINE